MNRALPVVRLQRGIGSPDMAREAAQDLKIRQLEFTRFAAELSIVVYH